MAGINQGRPETAIGEPIRFGDDLDFEIEQHPISDRLIIRDTANGKEAYVRADRGGTIGGDGVLIKALKEGKPVADDGRTHDTIQAAERAASSFVFVPPGTFNESVDIDTDGLTLRGSGRNTEIDGGQGSAVDVNAPGVIVRDCTVNQNTTGASGRVAAGTEGTHLLNLHSDQSSNDTLFVNGAGLIANCTVFDSSRFSLNCGGKNNIFVGNHLSNPSGGQAVNSNNEGHVLANNIVRDTGGHGIRIGADNMICIGNRVINANNVGIFVSSSAPNSIVANNRVSDSGNNDILDNATGTVLDSNLTGPSN